LADEAKRRPEDSSEQPFTDEQLSSSTGSDLNSEKRPARSRWRPRRSGGTR